MDIRWLMELMLQLYVNFTRETDIGSVFFLSDWSFPKYLPKQSTYFRDIDDTLLI